MEEEADIDFFLIELEVGEGPMRFAPKGERSLLEQISDLDEADQRCHRNLKRSWDEYDKKEFDMKDDMILRFARNTTKDNTFDEERAWKLMRKFKRRYAIASAHRLEKQLMTKVSRIFAARRSSSPLIFTDFATSNCFILYRLFSLSLG